MTLFRLIVWRHLLHEPLRTILTVLGVGLGVAVYVAVATANIEVLRTFEEGVLAVAGRTTLEVTSTAALPEGFDETVIASIRQADGVALATPVVELSTIWRGGTSGAVSLPVLGVDLLSESRVRDYTITSASSTEGSVENPAAGEADWERYLDPDAIFIGRAFAGRYGLVTGAPIDLQAGLRARRLVVRGIIEGKGPAAATLEELAVMDIAAAQLMFDRLGQLDRIDVITDSRRPVEDIAARIREGLPSGLLIKRPEQRNVQIERMTEAFRLNVASLSAVALLVGLFLVYNTMSFAVLRRRREIGILRSLGMLPYGIGRLFLLEGLLLGIVGWGVGILGGMVLAGFAIGMMATTSGDLYNIAVQHSQARIPMPVVAQSLFIGISVALLGSVGPIREASAVQPVRALAPRGYEIDAMKPVLPIFLKSMALFVLAGAAALAQPVRGLPIFGYLAAFLLIVAMAMLSPVVIRAMSPCLRAILPKGYRGVVRIAADELERASVRNAVAVSALMVGLALMIGMSILIQSFRQTVDVWLDQTVKADVIVAPPTWLGSGPAGFLPGSVRRRLEGIPGVRAVDFYRDLRMEFRDRSIALVARDLLIHARHSRYLFLKGDSSTILSHAVDNDEVIISETFANQFGLIQGQQMTLPTPRGLLQVRIAGVFYDYATDGGKIVMDRALFERFWDDRHVTVVPLYLAPEADVARIRAEILSRLAGEAPVILITNGELKREVLRIFDHTFAVTYALEFIALLVALLAIVNALLSGILERQGELAVIRAIGGTPRQIGRIVLWESCLIGMAGILLGVAAGILLSLLLIHVINKQSFGWSVVFYLSPVALLKAIGLVLITTLLAGYGPARRAAYLPMADSLRYE